MAKKYDSTTRQMALVAIAKHLKEQGDNDWHLVKKQFPTVPKSTFGRWVQTVRDNLRTDEGELRESAGIALEAADSLPAAPSPAYIAGEGQTANVNLNFMARLEELYKDSEMLRDFGMRDGKIVAPKYFSQSIHIRKGLMETALKAMAEVWDLRQMQAFYDIVLDEISKESPEVAQRIMDRLKALNAELGMTYDMARV